jgi:hypothetical protein
MLTGKRIPLLKYMFKPACCKQDKFKNLDVHSITRC